MFENLRMEYNDFLTEVRRKINFRKYTGTHDNAFICALYENKPAEVVDILEKIFLLGDREIVRVMALRTEYLDTPLTLAARFCPDTLPAIIEACMFSHSPRAAKRLLNKHNARGETALLLSLTYNKNYPKNARLLVESGACVNAADVDGETPLMQSPNREMTKFLLDKGARVDARNKISGLDVLAYLASDAGSVSLLLEAGANVHSRGRSGRTALFFASPESVPLLAAAGADVNARDNEGRSVLVNAALGEHGYKTVRALLVSGATFTEKDDETISKSVFGGTRLSAHLERAKDDIGEKYMYAAAAESLETLDELNATYGKFVENYMTQSFFTENDAVASAASAMLDFGAEMFLRTPMYFSIEKFVKESFEDETVRYAYLEQILDSARKIAEKETKKHAAEKNTSSQTENYDDCSFPVL